MELIKNQHINYFFEPAKSENKKGNIIFIHGFNALPSYFYLVSDYFIEYDCYFICLPGHGYTKVVNEKDLNPISFADAIINLIHKLDLKKFYLLGHSLGGAIACMLAEALITRVEKLIVVCPFFYGFNKKILGAYALLPWFARKHPDKALKKIYFDYRNNFITHPKTRPEITPSSQNKEKYLWKLLLNMGFSSETHKRLKYAQSNLIVPTLLINSKNDQLIDYKTAAKKLAKTKDLQIYTFYKSGHIPFVEEPDLFAKVVLDYLNDRLVEQTQNEEVEESEVILLNKKQTNKKPLFIVFEGIDGAGKSTVLYTVSKRLKAKTKRKIIITREPGGENCTSAESIRSLLLENIDNFTPTTCAYLYASSRNEHIQKVLKPNLVNDNVVICDRFIYSSYLYQGIAQNVGLENVRLINQAAVESINIDYVFYFDISYKNAMARIDRRIDTNSFDNQKKEFYFNLLKNYPKILYDPVYNHNAEIIMVNANLDFESVVNFIVKKIAKIIKQQENS